MTTETESKLQQRVADLEGRVASLEGRLQLALTDVGMLRANEAQAAEAAATAVITSAELIEKLRQASKA